MRQDLQRRLDGAEVLTKPEFRDRSLKQWLFRTGAGLALIGGALLGILVGTVIVAQTLYSSTKDHLNEFATLARARVIVRLYPQGHPGPGRASAP